MVNESESVHDYSVCFFLPSCPFNVCRTPGSAARAMRVPLRPTPRWRSMLLRATAEADVVHGPPYFREGRATRSIFHVCRELNSKSIISLENRIATLDLRRR